MKTDVGTVGSKGELFPPKRIAKFSLGSWKDENYIDSS